MIQILLGNNLKTFLMKKNEINSPVSFVRIAAWPTDFCPSKLSVASAVYSAPRAARLVSNVA